MQHDIVPFRDDALELDALARKFLRHLLEVGDEAVLLICDTGIVLDVGLPAY
jgi:hypothetical protein